MATSPNVRMARKKEESVRDGINQAVGSVQGSAFPGDVKPDFIQVQFERRDAPSAARLFFCSQTGTPTLFHFLGECTHGLRSDHTPFTASEGRPRVIKGC